MKKSIKQLLSAVLVIAMLATLLVVPAAAADPRTKWDFKNVGEFFTNGSHGEFEFNGNSGDLEGLTVDATASGAKFSTTGRTDSGWAQINKGTKITVPVQAPAGKHVQVTLLTYGAGIVTVDGQENSKDQQNEVFDCAGTNGVEIVCTKDGGYIGVIEVAIVDGALADDVYTITAPAKAVVKVGETINVDVSANKDGVVYANTEDTELITLGTIAEGKLPITGVKAGTASIYLGVTDGKGSKEIEVTVLEPVTGPVTKWDFSAADFSGVITTADTEYNGLKLKNVKSHNGKYAHFGTNAVMRVPVSGPCALIVNCEYGNSGTVGDMPLEGDNGAGIDTTVYYYTGEAGYVDIAYGNSGSLYLTSVELATTNWDFSAADFAGKITTTDTEYNGLKLKNVKSHNSKYAHFGTDAVMQVPVLGPCNVTVNCEYGNSGTVGDMALEGDNGAGIDTTVYHYDGEAGYVDIAYGNSGSLYLTSVSLSAYTDPSAQLELSAERAELKLGGQAVEITAKVVNGTATGDMTATVPEADKDMVTATVAEGKVTLTPGTKAGKTTVTVSVPAKNSKDEPNTATAEIAVEVIDPNVTPTLWDFSDEAWTSQSGATVAEYKGLVMSGIQVNKTYALGKTGATIAIPVDGPCKVTVSYCYSASGIVGDTAFGTTSGSTSTIESTTGTYTGGKGTAKIIKMTAKSGDDSTYITKIEVEPLEGITPNSVNVWDFGAEALDTSLFVNKLTVENINAQYPEGTEVKTGIAIPPAGFNFYDGALQFHTNEKDNNRLRTTNTAIIRYDEKSLLGAVGADPYLPDEVEKDAESGEVKGGETYTGYVYSNSGSQPLVNLTMQLTAGDKVTFMSGSNGNAEHYELKAPSGAIESAEFLNAAKAEPLTFFAKETGEYTYYGTDEKLVVGRIYQEPGVKVTVTGNVDQSLATGLTGAYSVVYTGPGGVETKAPVENGKYTIELNNYLSGADYVVSLEGADGFIVAQGEEFSLAQTDREGTNDIIVASVDLVEITGKVTGLAEADLANLKLVITKPEGKIYQPKLIPAADGTFTAKFEKGVEYTVEALNVNDYALAKTKLAYTASGADDVVFSAKPTYEITMVPTPADVDLSAATITFTNKDEVDEAHPDGYVYTFTGPKGIKLRDAQYVVEVKGASGIQKLTPDLLVVGADTTCEVPFLNVTPTLWDFSDATWTSQSGAVEAYNGLVMTGVMVNKTYALGNEGATIQVPVDGACTVAVSYCYKAAGTVGDVTFGTESGSTGTIETTSYKYTGEKGTVEIKYTGQSYLTKIEVIKTTPYAETVTVGADKQYKTINEALAAVKTMERTAEQRVTILIDPGDYEEMLRIDTPNVTFKNASATPSIALKNKGVDIDANAVRITSYYGHGYAYYSMESDCTYSAERLAINKQNGRLSFENPGTGTTSGSYWNATVRVMASGVRAEGIIFENSFNQYVSKKAAEDVIVKLAGAKEGSVPRAEMKAGDTTVQHKEYVERAAALAIDNNCKEIFFDNCRFVGRQDTLYGGVNSTVGFYNCAVMGGTDYIFGGMIAVFAKCDLVFNTNDQTPKGQKDDVGYITAPQQSSGRGYLMYNCHITSTTPGVDTASVNVAKPGLLGRPWNGAKSEAVFYATNVDATDPIYYTGDTAKGTSMIQGVAWSSGLSSASGLVGDYDTVEYFEGADTSADRISWSAKFTEAKTADGASMTDTKAWLGDWDAFAGKDMTVVKQTPKPFNAEVLKEELKKAITAANGIYTVAPDTKAEGTAVADVERGTEFVYESDKAALKDAVAAAQAVVDNASATTADVLAAQKALAAAVKNFTNALKTGTKAPNTEALAKAIADAKAAKDGVMISNNTADKVNQGVTFAPKAALDALNAALKEAETTLASNNATQADVDAAKAALDQAVAAFNAAKNTGTKVPGTGVDKTELEAAVTAAEGVYAIGDDVVVKPANTKASAVEKGQKFVTQDVYDALAKAIADAKAVLADKDATEEDVTKALADLKAAQEAFKVLTGTKSSGSTTGRPSSGRGDRGPSASKLPFTDVKAEDWFYASVEKAFAKGLMKGTSETTFAPDAKTTRAMVATILYRLAGENKTDVASLFNDVAADTWYTDAVAWAAEKGIIKGYNDTTFGPENNVTREQLIVMLYRYAGVTAKSEKDLSAFTDTAAISDWAVDAMTWAVEKGILLGRGNGQLDPKGVASRAEVCTVLVRFLEMK